MTGVTQIFHRSPTAPAKINARRVDKIHAGFEHNGKVYDTDQFSIDLMKGQVLEALARKELGLAEESIEWRISDNSTTVLTVTEYLELFVAFSQFVRTTMQQSWTDKGNL